MPKEMPRCVLMATQTISRIRPRAAAMGLVGEKSNQQDDANANSNDQSESKQSDEDANKDNLRSAG